MYLDAKRLNLENAEGYAMGILVPTGGFVVVPYYVSQRRTLPKREDDTP